MEFLSFVDIDAIGTIRTNLKQPLNHKMANTRPSKFLTLVLLAIVFVSQIGIIFGDLAPREDEDEDVKPPTDLKKPDELMTTLEPPKPGSNLGFIHAFIASFSVILVSEIGGKIKIDILNKVKIS